MTNKQRFFLTILAALMAPLVFGSSGDECVIAPIDPNSIGFEYDPNSLVVNPETDSVDILRSAIVEIGTTVTFTGDICDPDGDPIDTVWVSDPNTYAFAYDPNEATWTLTYTPTEIGIMYAWIGATDAPATEPNVPRTSKMNVLIAGVPRNSAPVIRCGGTTTQ